MADYDMTGVNITNLALLNGAAVGGGGAMELISTTVVSASVASVDFTGLSGYDNIVIKYSGLVQSTAASLEYLASTDNGSTFITTASYRYNTTDYTNGSVDSILSNVGYARSGTVEISGIQSATLTKTSIANGVSWNNFTNAVLSNQKNNVLNITSAIDAIRFQTSSGTIDSGTISIYGVKS